jgi:hypothetical protein
MTENNPMHVHYTVISRAGEGRTSRVVIAGSCADAAETHFSTTRATPSFASHRLLRQ